jgi:hypothetical protein
MQFNKLPGTYDNGTEVHSLKQSGTVAHETVSAAGKRRLNAARKAQLFRDKTRYIWTGES